MKELSGIEELEKSVLCAAMYQDAAGEIVTTLDEQDFQSLPGRKLFSIVSQINAEGHEVTTEEVLLRIREIPDEKALSLGLLAWYGSASEYMTDSWRRSVALLRDNRHWESLRSRVFGWGSVESPSAVPAVREELRDELAYYERTSLDRSHVPSLSDSLDDLEHDLEPARSTGFSKLDAFLSGGLRPGQLVVCAGRPGMGKSAWAMNLSARMASASEPVTVQFFTLEMSTRETLQRLVSSESGVPLGKLLTGDWKRDRSDAATVRSAMERIRHWPLEVVDHGVSTVSDVQRRVLTAPVSPFLVVIDYLTLLDPDRSKDSRYLEVGEMTRRLKAFAREQQVCVLLLSQLSRAPETRPDKRPRQSDLRESGSIEQDANIVLFPWRPGSYEELVTRHGQGSFELKDRLLVAKNRNGTTGEIYMTFDGPVTRWSEIDFHGDRYAEAG